uniref:conjugative transposon protein TraM n=1 Tax=Pedobacter schmidteae TaxID=2201271 RepID=UPI000EB25D96|nr:conjugative transposon protein TraM [Pedobacter schmidteae]
MKSENVKVEKRRKFLLVLPLIVIPFLAAIFYSFKEDEGTANPLQEAAVKGLQAGLPDANVKKEPENKLSYYEAAEQDSAKRSEQMRNDPYFQNAYAYQPPGTMPPASAYGPNYGAGYNPGPYMPEARENAVYSRLNALNATLNQPAPMPPANNPYPANESEPMNGEVDRLEKMMKMMSSGAGEEDPEMKNIDGMLDKLLDIQNPARVQERMRKNSKESRGQVFQVTGETPKREITALYNDTEKISKHSNGFFAFENSKQEQETPAGTIKAVVHQNQTIVAGAVIKLRLLNDIYVNGFKIPKDNFLYGLASLDGERLNIGISNIQYQDIIFPVQLTVYDMDGLNGIHIPGAISREISKQGGSDAISSIGLSGLDPSIGAQAATAGIEITKNLIGRKVKMVRVTVKAGYQVLLRDENSKEKK